MMQQITIHDEHFSLDPTGAIFWHEQNMLMIADVHFGKVAHFRKYGAAVPSRASSANYKKLAEAMERHNPDTICFLGDLFHSTLNNEWRLFETWAKNTMAKIILVSGNHDIISPHKFEALGISVSEGLKITSFLLTHHPTEREGYFNFSGHIHPGINMQGTGRQSIKLACFYKKEHQLILPAFGNFTGKYILHPSEKDTVYAIVDGEVICVS
ncbi:ligase-associated DNA damage response endonuclease PdeM [Marixanthomonas spongiae]|uniref:Ligase-associated DNA damage response endonuclease PdeM n=1 Tax=Marixanthomonas spongiae TaxID=2174845 RepID=A0A2U0I2J2_9FLAO|nr:ligase-associated DNA damage response endonuclease PdeM [Marixanthomonas spongiae]PVW15332.1 ligase-associated DNA damage response endonuclease PdeM [Marixanthomonas spongiae]